MTIDPPRRLPTAALGLRGTLQRYAPAIAAALFFALVAVAGGELVIRRLTGREVTDALVRAEVGAGTTEQLVLRRVEAVDVLHRLAQAWFTLRENGNAEGAAALEEHLATTANAGSFGLAQVAVIGTDGWMEWSSISRRASRVDLGDREHFRVHAEGRRDLFVSEPVLGRVSRRWTVQFTRPLLDRTGAFAGVVVVSLDMLNLSEALADLHRGSRDRAFLLRGEALLAADGIRPETRIGRELPVADPLRQRPPGQASGATRRSGSDGRGTFTGWHAVPGTGLTVVYVLDEEEAALDANFAASIRLVALGVGILVMAGAVILMLARERRRVRRELLQAEQERSLSDAAHRMVERRIASLPAVVFGGLVRPDGGFALTHVSESLSRITGWTPADLPSGQPWLAMSVGASADDHLRFRRDVIAAGQGTREFRIRHPDGTMSLIREHLRVVETDATGATEVVGYLRDITAERDIEAKAQVSARLATLGEMATGLAHELNQPLAVMSLAADNGARALQRRGADAIPEVLQRLDRIGIQGRRARDIVDHLRVFGRAQEDVPAEPVRVADAVEGAAVLTRAALRAAGIALEVELPDDLPRVMGQLIPLEQTLVNLLLNARDAIEERRIDEGRVRIVGKASGDAVELSITDNGGGVPEAVLPRLFAPFFTTKPPGKGTGLGLPICHAAMRSFGGRIEVDNVAAGARFTLFFEAAPADPAPASSAAVEAAGEDVNP